MDHGGIAVLDLENTVKFQHHHARKGGRFKDHVVSNPTRNSVDEWKVPFVFVANLTLEHGHVFCCGLVVKVNNKGQGVSIVKEEFVVVVLLNHVGDFVLISVHIGRVPPFSFPNIGGLVGRRLNRDCHG